MSPALRVSLHAVDRYCERVLRWPAGKVSPEEFAAAETEILALCERGARLKLPRFVIRFHHFSIVIVEGTVVTVLDSTHRHWAGKFNPN